MEGGVFLRTTFWNTLWLLILSGQYSQCQCATYEQSLALYNKLKSQNYSTQLLPTRNQLETFRVGFHFSIVSLVNVDDVSQSVTVNILMVLEWKDELMSWDPEDYGGLEAISVDGKDAWKPQLMFVNAIKDKEIFKDPESYSLYINHTGIVLWYPAMIPTVFCSLDMTHYPFDVQTCSLQLMAVDYDSDRVEYYATDTEVSRDPNFSENSEWELVSTNVEARAVKYQYGSDVSSIKATVKIKRRPTSLVISPILPVVFLSFLNLLVFLVPVESGEKVTYGITVLLALAVFMSNISDMLPRSSVYLPSLKVYIFVLLISSVIDVIISIGVVVLHGMDEKQPSNIVSVGAVELNPDPPYTKSDKKDTRPTDETVTNGNRWKALSKKVNKWTFIVSLIGWAGLTIVFLSYIPS